jgi:DNA mismatch repair protein MutS
LSASKVVAASELPPPSLSAPSPLEDALDAIDPDSLTPREALDALYRLKQSRKAV